ncbi:lytic transglycosylase domain-containing protein [Chitiniphilus purpureus]|uniref:Lytic transglycosylase domain-containing protein n=1 Tax=Chitiniphilus purpureus TaxID=2981137 RepID=A0ABY6DQ11_9NEIS|nr:lytic transglycosylase domain-containing protein [Chitiniphilus sp. CD1]UXY15171.1 lytic transglycosylase domain-containing protein [Chitiniphilus sp. CD1]
MKSFAAVSFLLSSLCAQAALDLDLLRDAVRSRDLARLSALTEAASGDVLEMYPRYHLLSAQLPAAADESVQAFLQRYPNTPLAERLRGEWLAVLGKRGDWDRFIAQYDKLEAPTTELVCYAAQAGLARGKPAAAQPVKTLWAVGRAQSDACGPVFDWLFNTGQLGSDDVWLRIRDALARNNADFARQVAARVGNPPELQAKSLTLASRDPVKALTGYNVERRAGREAALYALSRLARTNPDAAAAWLENRSDGWPAEDRRYGWQQVAEAAAKQRHPQASRWFSQGGMPQQPHQTTARAWAIRAALRAYDTGALLERIDALPASEAADPAWRYWKAQALKARQRGAEAEALLAGVASNDDYYGLLAHGELQTPLAAANQTQPYRPGDAEIAAMRARPGIARALALLDGGWRVEGVREWNWALRGTSQPELVAAAHLAQRAGHYDRAIYAAEQAKTFAELALRYPQPFRGQIERQARQNGLDAAWVFGLIRQESRFVTNARSHVGAGGLMQLMPATAKWVSAKLDNGTFKQADVHQPESNLEMGAFYLRYILDRLQSHPVLATAGYNAGPGRARAWQDSAALDAAVYIETIPFDETRDYVKKVLANAHVYRYAYPGAPTLQERLTPIPPRGGTVDAP